MIEKILHTNIDTYSGLPKGVQAHDGKYSAYIHSFFVDTVAPLGEYNTIKEAHREWQQAFISEALFILEDYSRDEEGFDENLAYRALEKVQTVIADYSSKSITGKRVADG